VRPYGLPRQSSEKAFESLYRRHLREIYGYALALLDSPADAEDATQATFLNAYRALERGERPRNASGWLRAIALNVCREHFRRASRRPDEVSLDEDPGDLVVEASGPTVGEVVRALSHLPFNQRAALVMREFEGRSLSEIAEQLGVTASAVEALLFRARRGLGEQLEASLGCAEAERAISRQLDRALPRSERAALRAHLRECPGCASLARRVRAQRSTLKSLALVPVPVSLAWGRLAPSGPASTAAGASLASAGAVPVAVKVLGVAGLAALAMGGGYAALGRQAARAPARGHVFAVGPSPAMGARSAVLAGSALAADAPMEAWSPGRGQTLARRGGGAMRAAKHGNQRSHSARSWASGRGASAAAANAGGAESHTGARRGEAPGTRAQRSATPTRRSASSGNVAPRHSPAPSRQAGGQRRPGGGAGGRGK
jgi:RNA polymerase sigma factor (sigma-70 family)